MGIAGAFALAGLGYGIYKISSDEEQTKHLSTIG